MLKLIEKEKKLKKINKRTGSCIIWHFFIRNTFDRILLKNLLEYNVPTGMYNFNLILPGIFHPAWSCLLCIENWWDI